MTRKHAYACTVLGHAILLIPAAAMLFGGSPCQAIGHTGEGFPAYACSDDRVFYQDLDGDGRDQATIGRWVETDPDWIIRD